MNPATASKTLEHVPGWMGPVIRIYSDPPLPYGAITDGTRFDPSIVQREDIVMDFVLYTTIDPVHGLLGFERIVELPDKVEPELQRYFFGYHCLTCGQVFLVPDWVKDSGDLHRAMRHDCAGIKSNSGVTR